MDENYEAVGTVNKEDDFVQQHTVEFAMAGMKKELREQVQDMPIEVLHMLVKMLKDRDWIALQNLNDFVAFIRSLGNLLPHDKQVELFGYTEGFAKEVLREKVTREITKNITEAIHEAIEKQKRKDLSDALETAGYQSRKELKDWMMKNARNAFRDEDDEEGDHPNYIHRSSICG